MNIGILSDSHLSYSLIKNNNKKYQEIINLLKGLFGDVDQIIHAGDIESAQFLRDLEKIAPVSAVRGNMDYDPILKKLPKKLELNLEGIDIGITHRPEDFIYFDNDTINIFIHGHTHVAQIKTLDNVLWINPGSLTRPRQPSRVRGYFESPNPRPSVAFLTISDGIFSAYIKPLQK